MKNHLYVAPMFPLLLLLALFLALTVLCLEPASATYATTITVDTLDDELNSDGDCSLREAIQAANTDTAVSGCPAGKGADTITLPEGTYTLTIPGASEGENATGDLDITKPLTISGVEGGVTKILAGTTIVNSIDRVLDIRGNVYVELNNLWIGYGRTPNVSGERRGGGIRTDNILGLTLNNCVIRNNRALDYGGGLYAQGGTVTANQTTFIYNEAESGGGAIYNHSIMTLTNSLVQNSGSFDWGGGIDNSSTLNLIDTTVHDNWANGKGGGISNRGTLYVEGCVITDNLADQDHDLDGNGGGIWNDGPLDVYSSVIADNDALNGGGVYNNGDDTVVLSKSSVAGNDCGYAGAGIYNADPQALMVLHRSTIRDNQTGMGSGGGIYHTGGDLTLNTCTVSGNDSAQSGGGIYAHAGTVQLSNSTVAYNRADADGSGSGDGGGIYVNGGTVQVKNSLIGSNTDFVPRAPDCGGTLNSQGYNLVEDTSNCTFIVSTADITGQDPKLDILKDNGGPPTGSGEAPRTHALLSGSPAIEKIPRGTNGCQEGISVDQRGYPRASRVGFGGTKCDIGAYESDSKPRIVEFTGWTYSITEAPGDKDFWVYLIPKSGTAVTVDYATLDGTAMAGKDYVALSDTIIYPPGIYSYTFSVEIMDDALDEDDETVLVALSNPVNTSIGGVNPVTLTIKDDDPLPTVRFSTADYSASEGAGSAGITINLTPASGRRVSVGVATSDGTATSGSDYTANEEWVVFDPGDTSGTFEVPIIDDEVEEPNETVLLYLANPDNATIGGTNPAILTIADGYAVYLPVVLR